jgi:hypothetical protein
MQVGLPVVDQTLNRHPWGRSGTVSDPDNVTFPAGFPARSLCPGSTDTSGSEIAKMNDDKPVVRPRYHNKYLVNTL